jgi:hypothetical protein
MEGMLIGAAVGGGTALLTGEDVLTGALLGAGTAGLTQGAQGLLGATNTAALTGVDTAVDAGVGVTAEAAKDAALTSQVASQQAMLQPTTTAIGGANLTGTGSVAASQAPTAVSQNLYPDFNRALASNMPQAATSDVVLPGAQQGIARAATQPGLMDRISTGYSNLSTPAKIGVGIGGGALLSSALAPSVTQPEEEEYDGPLSKFKYDPNKFNPTRVVPNVYQPRYAQGGIAALAGGGYPMGRQDNTQFATPTQMPMSAEVLRADYEPMDMARGGIAGYSLGGYAAGGNPRLLKGPGDGMSDDIPATIANKQPARLADGEFVVPADVVSHLGNGSTDAGAKHLYKMMDKVRKARTGKKAQGKQIKSERFLPA